MMAGGGLGSDQLTAVGDLGATILAGVPEALRSQVEPFIPALVNAIYEAFTLATAGTFTVGIVCSLLAAGLVLLLREAPVMESSPATASMATAADGPDVRDGLRPLPADGQPIPVSVEIEDDSRPDGRH